MISTLHGFEPGAIVATTKAEAAYLELRRRILTSALEPGATLDQGALAAEFGVSATPLREALRRLEGEGLVNLEVHRKVQIVPLNLRELRERYSVRLQLDPFAVELAVSNASEAQIEEIQAKARVPTSTDPLIQLDRNRIFHRTIYVSSGNSPLIGILDHLWDHTDRYRLILLKRGVHVGVAAKEHEEMAAAIAAREQARAKDLMRQHVQSALRTIWEALDEG